MFQRCIIIGLYYFSLEQVNKSKCITTVRDSIGHNLYKSPITWIRSYFCLTMITVYHRTPELGIGEARNSQLVDVRGEFLSIFLIESCEISL